MRPDNCTMKRDTGPDTPLTERVQDKLEALICDLQKANDETRRLWLELQGVCEARRELECELFGGKATEGVISGIRDAGEKIIRVGTQYHKSELHARNLLAKLEQVEHVMEAV
ncbi:MAG: hypothetical protein WC869_00785 [Phycisphaerae bacterium]|jgi:hypothetical protein